MIDWLLIGGTVLLVALGIRFILQRDRKRRRTEARRDRWRQGKVKKRIWHELTRNRRVKRIGYQDSTKTAG